MPDYGANELWEQTVRSPFPRIVPEAVAAKTVGPITGAPTLEVGYPLGFDENLNVWLPWSSAGSGGLDTIRGFIYPEDLETHATEDVLCNVMEQGRIHYDDIILPDGESEADLKAALQPNALARGLIVRGLEKVR